jgi:hypothetical protein
LRDIILIVNVESPKLMIRFSESESRGCLVLQLMSTPIDIFVSFMAARDVDHITLFIEVRDEKLLGG